MSKRRVMWLAAAMAAGVLGWAAGMTARGDVVTYTVDPTQSSLTLSGTHNGAPLTAWSIANGSEGSVDGLTAPYVGTIVADFNQASNTLQLTQGTIQAEAVDYYSSPPGSSYIFFANGDDPQHTYNMDMRGLSISLTSPFYNDASSFDVSQLDATIGAGSLEYSKYFFPDGFNSVLQSSGSSPLTGALNLSPLDGSVKITGGVNTLSLPVDTDFTVVADGEAFTFHLSGSIVATSVPEPSTAALAILAATALALPRLRIFPNKIVLRKKIRMTYEKSHTT